MLRLALIAWFVFGFPDRRRFALLTGIIIASFVVQFFGGCAAMRRDVREVDTYGEYDVKDETASVGAKFYFRDYK